VWRLVTTVRHTTVFSHGAFRYVHVMISALVAGVLLVFALAAVLTPREAVALLICGAVLAILGIALLLLRMPLSQAVAHHVEASRRQTQLEEVI
jgi:hypothetical protein